MRRARSDGSGEEAGRWEVVLAGQTIRRRATAGAVAGLGTGLLTLWAVTAAAYVAVGRSPDARFAVTASLFTATATVAAAAMFLAVGALCAQIAATCRQAASTAAAVFGAAYLIRVVAYSGTTLLWLRWASPLGWVDELRPPTGSRPLPLVFIVGTLAALAARAIVLAGRRDLGASVLPAHDTAAARTRLLTSPLGLAYRLGRGAVLGWSAGLAAGGLILGLSAKGAEQVWANQSGGIFARLAGASGGAIYLGIVFLLFAALIAMAAGGQVTATREEEAEGYLDHLLARPVARLSWLAGRFAAAAAGLAIIGVVAGLFTWAGAAATGAGLSLATLLAAGVNLVPAGIFVLGIGTLAYGLAPRYAAAVAYGLVALVVPPGDPRRQPRPQPLAARPVGPAPHRPRAGSPGAMGHGRHPDRRRHRRDAGIRPPRPPGRMNAGLPRARGNGALRAGARPGQGGRPLRSPMIRTDRPAFRRCPTPGQAVKRRQRARAPRWPWRSPRHWAGLSSWCPSGTSLGVVPPAVGIAPASRQVINMARG
ncbi:MAG: hypothetical protein ACYCVZ_12930 [Streptosporangiaceae bacterium]